MVFKVSNCWFFFFYKVSGKQTTYDCLKEMVSRRSAASQWQDCSGYYVKDTCLELRGKEMEDLISFLGSFNKASLLFHPFLFGDYFNCCDVAAIRGSAAWLCVCCRKALRSWLSCSFPVALPRLAPGFVCLRARPWVGRTV